MKKKLREHLLSYELSPLPRDTKMPFEETNNKKWYKVYKDGNHFVGTYINNFSKKKKYSKDVVITKEQRLFDELYVDAMKQGIKQYKLFSHLKNVMLDNMPEIADIDKFLTDNIKRKRHNFFVRLKRFKRKANLNLWNKFVTITYDDKKMDAETFRKKLRKCLSNLHSRRKWRYMGVFENGEIGERLHFHALMYIPEDQMIGEILEQKDYSTKDHKMQITHANTFFTETFGRNDFEDLSQNEIRYGNTLEYLTKYLQKTNEKIVYSRGVPSEICKEIDDFDIATEMFDFGLKYVFFDDVIDFERDIMHIQSTMFDNPLYMTG